MSAPQNVLSFLNAPTAAERLRALSELLNQQKSTEILFRQALEGFAVTGFAFRLQFLSRVLS